MTASPLFSTLLYQPQGFSSCAKNIGIKDSTLDFTVVFSERPAAAAAMFTQNRFCGAPIIVGREHVTDGQLQAIVVTSKNANVATGQQGIENAREITRLVAAELGIRPVDVLPSSTGVIGRQLPMEKIRSGIRGVREELRPGTLESSAQAILTTDTRPKMRCARVGATTLVGMCKGVGMIEPNMATLLAYFYTDTTIPAHTLTTLLGDAVEPSFNSVSVDTDTSTSDTVAIMANGSAGEVNLSDFGDTLTAMAIELAKEVARDGEGATKLIEVLVEGAASAAQAKRVAKSIVNSPLVKTAVYGADPNWGRVAMAIGKCSEYSDIDPAKVQIAFGNVPVYAGHDLGEAPLAHVKGYLSQPEVLIHVQLGIGSAQARVWGCDLTEGYIEINGKYTT